MLITRKRGNDEETDGISSGDCVLRNELAGSRSAGLQLKVQQITTTSPQFMEPVSAEVTSTVYALLQVGISMPTKSKMPPIPLAGFQWPFFLVRP
jgi:hypothetical protein